MKRFLLNGLVVCLSVAAYGASDGGRADNFLNYAASARAVGMGQAHVGVADDSSAIYWNPAGLSQLKRSDIVTMYSALQENSGYGFASYAFPTTHAGAWGLGLANLNSGNFKRRDDFGNQTGTFGTSSSALLLSNSFGLGTRALLGTTLKIIRQEVADASDTGFGADVGALFRASSRWKLGLVLRNAVAPSVQLKSEADRYPRDVRLGTEFMATKRWMLATDFSKAQDQGVKANFGTDWRLNELLSLRAGANQSEISAGLGFQFGDWGLDYAFGYQAFNSNLQDLGGTHKFGLHVNFGSEISSKPVLIVKHDPNYYVQALSDAVDNSTAPARNLKSTLNGARHELEAGAYPAEKDRARVDAYLAFFAGDYSTSAEKLKVAQKADPKNKTLKQQLAKVQDLKVQADQNKLAAGSLQQARDARAAGDRETAREMYQKVLNISPKNAEAQAAIAQINNSIKSEEMAAAKSKFDNGDYVEAFMHLKKVLEVDPNDREATEYTVRTLTLLEKESTDSSAQKKTVYEINQSVSKSMDLYSDGMTLYNQGKLQDAVKVWEKALSYAGGNYLARDAMNKALDEIQDKQLR